MIKNNYIMGEVINWGIIGLGNVAHEFAKSFYNTKNAKLIAIASKSENKLSNSRLILILIQVIVMMIMKSY